MARKLASGSDDERQASTTDGPSNRRLDRRSYLQLGGASVAGIGFGLLSAENGAAAAATRQGITFDRVVNAVDDLGLDPSGNQSVVNTLNDVASGTLVQFPEGDYRFDGQVAISNGTYGFESIGDQRATFVVDDGYADWLLNGHGMTGCFLSGINVDQQASQTIGCLRLIGDRIHIENVEFVGRADIWDVGAENMLNCAIEDPDGYGEVRNVVHTEGHWARYGPGAAGRIGIYTGARHRGTLKIVDCDLREFGNNALYCSRNYGAVQVEDSYFENNNAAQIRIGGEGSYAENCTIVTDPALYTGPRTYEDESFHHRAIVIEEHFDTGSIHHQKEAGAEVRNCEIRIEDNPANGAAIHRYGNGRSLRIEDTTIEYNNDDYPGVILARTGGFGINPDADDPRQVDLINSTVYGTGNVDVVVDIEGSDGSLIENSIIHFEDGAQTGVKISNTDDAQVVDSTISVPGRATVFENADVYTSNLSTDPPEDLEPAPPGDDELDHQLRLIADDSADAFEYEFTVDGTVELVTDGDYPAHPDGETIYDNNDGTQTVEGVVAGYEGDDTRWGGDTFAFEGTVTAFTKDGPGTIFLDGDAVDVADLVGDDQHDEGPSLDRQLRIIAEEEADAYDYEFTVVGDVELVTEGDYPANPGGESIIDNGDGTQTVEGVVAGYEGEDTRWGGDTFAFDGTIIAFDKGGPGTVLVDGEVVNPDELAADEERIVIIESDLHAEEVTYSFTVKGDVAAHARGSLLDFADSNEPATETIEQVDAATYSVTGSLDGAKRAAYAVEGMLSGFELDGPGQVRIDNELVDLDVYGLPDQLTIVGLGEPASYELTVDGELKADPMGPEKTLDDLSGSTAEGALTDGIASFRFDGDLTEFTLTGDAGVYLNGAQVDPSMLIGDEDPVLENYLVLAGRGSETEYELAVSGSIHKAPDIGPVESTDTIENGLVEGTVTTEVDGYRFSGTLESLWIWGAAEVYFSK